MAIDKTHLPMAFAELSQRTNAFFGHLDAFRYDDLVAMMEPEARWHRQGRVLRGAAEALPALETRSRTQRIRHVITNLQITALDADEARTTAYMTVYRHDEGRDAEPPRTIRGGPSSFLLVETHWRRHTDDWLIAEQAAHPEFLFTAD